MDTSKEYIKMCEKVPDEMKQKFHGQTDWYVYIKSGFLEEVFIFGDIALQNRKFDVIFPIFRQDQLQEMVKFEPWEAQKTPLHRLFFNFREFVQNGDADSWWSFKEEFTSMEQLWLAFVMKEKYNKTWNGNEWTATEG